MAAPAPSPLPSNVKTTSKRSWPRVSRYPRGRRRFLGPPTGTSSRRCVPRSFMSKELVISAASHERRVAILEEGQLVEIYIEREKEFALVGSIYKGKVTRVLPGMQSAFVDIGLDGDAFLYVSDVFENLEDYDHGHSHDAPAVAPVINGAATSTIGLLPGETLHAAHTDHEEIPLAPHELEHLQDIAPIEHLSGGEGEIHAEEHLAHE